MLFEKLYPRLKLTGQSKSKRVEDRLKGLESGLADLRVTIKQLLEILEKTLEKDLDQDGVVGRASPRRGLPKTARLQTGLPARRNRPGSALPLSYP